jgi:2-keto-3-deoxy-L-rhamnonate aldolase RhmA
MKTISNRAKEQLKAGKLSLGMGVRQARTVDIAIIARTAGYDWLFIDMEHSSMDVDMAAQISAAALDAGITPIVRVPGHEHFHASRLLDTGALGIVVPHVNNAAEAERAVSHCRFPPQGKRSLPGTLPQARFEPVPIAELAAAVNEATLVVVMIETPEAIDNADAIAAVSGADVLLIGTNDLAAEMGITGQFGHEKVGAAYRKVVAACRRHGKFAGMGGVYDHALMERYIGLGARFILSGSDLSFVMAGAKARSNFLHGLSIKPGA